MRASIAMTTVRSGSICSMPSDASALLDVTSPSAGASSASVDDRDYFGPKALILPVLTCIRVLALHEPNERIALRATQMQGILDVDVEASVACIYLVEEGV